MDIPSQVVLVIFLWGMFIIYFVNRVKKSHAAQKALRERVENGSKACIFKSLKERLLQNPGDITALYTLRHHLRDEVLFLEEWQKKIILRGLDQDSPRRHIKYTMKLVGL